MLAVNPKAYLKYFENEESNKKHKDVKGCQGMEFENFVQRKNLLNKIEKFKKGIIENMSNINLLSKVVE